MNKLELNRPCIFTFFTRFYWFFYSFQFRKKKRVKSSTWKVSEKNRIKLGEILKKKLNFHSCKSERRSSVSTKPLPLVVAYMQPNQIFPVSLIMKQNSPFDKKRYINAPFARGGRDAQRNYYNAPVDVQSVSLVGVTALGGVKKKNSLIFCVSLFSERAFEFMLIRLNRWRFFWLRVAKKFSRRFFDSHSYTLPAQSKLKVRKYTNWIYSW